MTTETEAPASIEADALFLAEAARAVPGWDRAGRFKALREALARLDAPGQPEEER